MTCAVLEMLSGAPAFEASGNTAWETIASWQTSKIRSCRSLLYGLATRGASTNDRDRADRTAGTRQPLFLGNPSSPGKTSHDIPPEPTLRSSRLIRPQSKAEAVPEISSGIVRLDGETELTGKVAFRQSGKPQIGHLLVTWSIRDFGGSRLQASSQGLFAGLLQGGTRRAHSGSTERPGNLALSCSLSGRHHGDGSS